MFSPLLKAGVGGEEVDLTENQVAHFLLNNNPDDCHGTYDGSISGTVDFTGDYVDPLSGSVTIPSTGGSWCSYWKDTGSGFVFTTSSTVPTSLATDNYSNLRVYSAEKTGAFLTALEDEGYYPKPLTLPTTTNLVAHYPLTGTAEDTTGNYDGTEGNTYVDDVEFGSVSDFNGTSDYIPLPTSLMELGDNFAICGWAKADDFGSVSNNLFEIKDSGTYPDHSTLLLVAGSSGTGYNYRFLCRNTTSNEINIQGGTQVAGIWNYFYMSYDGTTLIMKHNNVDVYNSSYTFSEAVYSTLSVHIGLDSSNRFMDGKIRGVRVYSEALTATEVTNIYNYEKNFRHIDIDNGLRAYYPLRNNAKDNYYNEVDATPDVGVSFDGDKATLPNGDNIAFTNALGGFVEAYYTIDGTVTKTTTESVLSSLTDCTLKDVRTYNIALSTEQQEIIGYTA